MFCSARICCFSGILLKARTVFSSHLASMSNLDETIHSVHQRCAGRHCSSQNLDKLDEFSQRLRPRVERPGRSKAELPSASALFGRSA